MKCNKRKWNQYEVTFRDLTGKNRFDDEYGFETNPPFITSSSSKQCLIKELKSRLKRDKIGIVKIRRDYV